MKTYTRISLLMVALSAILMTSCSQLSDINPLNIAKKKDKLADKLNTGTVVNYQSKMNLSYGDDFLQKYDLYTPVLDSVPEGTKSVSLVMVHGGGWSLLDKAFLNSVVEQFKNQKVNVSIFNINHRLAGQNGIVFKDIMEDFSLFFDHHKSMRDSLNLSDDIILWGYSSGGHLALTYSYEYPSPDIKAVAAVVAPTDLTEESIYNNIYDDKNRNLTELLIGAPYTQNPQAYKEASPFYKVSRNSSSTILFYGGNDNLVSTAQGEKLYKALKDKKVGTEFQVIPNADHEMNGKMPLVVNETVRFLKTL
ncbi:MAG: alpha/beta hydrolase [Cytophagales bacterium]|nr:alpha/beta hydrolase [Cytophagales bacterium]